MNDLLINALVVMLFGVALLYLNIHAGVQWLKFVSYVGMLASFGYAGYLVLVGAAATLNWSILARRNKEKDRLIQSGEFDTEKDNDDNRLLLGDEHPLWKFQV